MIPKLVAHKWALSEVLLTDIREVTRGQYLIGAELPRAHPFYTDAASGTSRHDALAVLEICRQACFLIAHSYYQVPIGLHFILRTAGAELSSASALIVAARPHDLVVEAQIEREWRKGEGATGLMYRFRLCDTTGEVGRAEMSMSWIQPEQWAEFRAAGRLAKGLPADFGTPVEAMIPVSKHDAGREGVRNVAISDPQTDTSTGALLADVLLDGSHPIYFDHPLDHLSGMLQFEVYRQTAAVAALERHALCPERAVLVGCRASFSSFCELDYPTRCHAIIESLRHRRSSVEVTASATLVQTHSDLARATLKLTYPIRIR